MGCWLPLQTHAQVELCFYPAHDFMCCETSVRIWNQCQDMPGSEHGPPHGASTSSNRFFWPLCIHDILSNLCCKRAGVFSIFPTRPSPFCSASNARCCYGCCCRSKSNLAGPIFSDPRDKSGARLCSSASGCPGMHRLSRGCCTHARTRLASYL